MLGKRVFDLALVFLTSPIWLPVIGLIWLLVRMKIGSPVWFCQTRPGRQGKPFAVIKIRTMTDAMDENGHPLPDADRLTNFGQWLRSTSLDELPELIIKGEMSLVGPRPLLVDYMPLYSERQAKRHNVLPGITGWAQVNGRNALSWAEKFQLDVWYVENRSLILDIKILYKTISKVLFRKDISSEGNATMPKFTGN